MSYSLGTADVDDTPDLLQFGCPTTERRHDWTYGIAAHLDADDDSTLGRANIASIPRCVDQRLAGTDLALANDSPLGPCVGALSFAGWRTGPFD